MVKEAKELKTYSCPDCDFSTTNRHEFANHRRFKHPRGPQPVEKPSHVVADPTKEYKFEQLAAEYAGYRRAVLDILRVVKNADL